MIVGIEDFEGLSEHDESGDEITCLALSSDKLDFNESWYDEKEGKQ